MSAFYPKTQIPSDLTRETEKEYVRRMNAITIPQEYTDMMFSYCSGGSAVFDEDRYSIFWGEMEMGLKHLLPKVEADIRAQILLEKSRAETP